MTILISIITILITALSLSLFMDNKRHGNMQKNLRDMYVRTLKRFEKKEVEKHKWIESEKVGYDIGTQKALEDWNKNHAYLWRKSQEAKKKG